MSKVSVKNELNATAFYCVSCHILNLEPTTPPRLSAKDYLSETPLSKEETAHFKQCKDYYRITGKPLISIPPETLDSSTQVESSIIKFGIDEDFDRFELQEFMKKFRDAFHLNTDDFTVKEIQKGSVILTVDVFSNSTPSGKKNGLKLICQSCTDNLQNELGKMKTFFMFMGPEEALRKMQMHQAEIKLNPRFNRIYASGHNFWEGPLMDGKDRGNSPYYCPVGWKRWSFYVTDNFDTKFSGWCIGYHGTKFEYGLSILLNGLKPARAAELGPGVYATPSIIYACHPRYAEIKVIPAGARKFFKTGQYVQFVLECRVNPSDINRIGCETLHAKNFRIDPNIRNEAMEWVVNHHNKRILDFNDPDSPIVCTGLMIRVTDDHPGLLPESKWWFQSHICEGQGCCYPGISLALLNKKILGGDMCNIVND